MPTIKQTVTVEREVAFLQAECGVRYWEDATVNGSVASDDGEGVPCKSGDTWAPLIDLTSGIILDWPLGTTMEAHFKVCDAGRYKLLDADRQVVITRNDYVPAIMCPEGSGYGDYVIMKIGPDGQIANWRLDLSDFEKASGDE